MTENFRPLLKREFARSICSITAGMLVGVAGLVFSVEGNQTSLAADGDERQRVNQTTGRVEGRILKLSESPDFGGAKVQSIDLYISASPARAFAKAELNEEGHFVFEEVPVGKVTLNPIFQSRTNTMTFMVSPALRVPTTVATGEITKVAFFGRGRPITGRISLPAHLKPTDARVLLQLVAPPARISYDPMWQVYSALNARNLESALDADGRFRIEGVIEGNYWIGVQIVVAGQPLQLRFDHAAVAGHPYVEYGKLTVPLMADGESAEPHDLGTLRFEVPANSP